MSSTLVQRLAGFLSATQVRTSRAVVDELGCDRPSVETHVRTLRDLGVEVDYLPGQGYRLREPLELLERESILDRMDHQARNEITGFEIETTLDSTNSALQRLSVAKQHGRVILAECQTAGRGRRGRRWHSPFGRNLYLSLGWRFNQSLSELGCLPLVVALSAARALSRAGLEGHRVKWPNDLLIDGQKLCGCLVEMQGDARGPCDAILGVGINVHMPPSAETTEIDQPWTDLDSHLQNCSRNLLAVMLLEELIRRVSLFAVRGFEPFREGWREFDGLSGKIVRVTVGGRPLQGRAKGIDETGALLLDTGEEVLSLYSGEVRVNPAEWER